MKKHVVCLQRRGVAVAGRLAAALERNGGAGARFETFIYRELSGPTRRIMLRRLSALDRLLHESPRAKEDYERAARRIGSGVRNVYRLLGRMKAHGPVRGLAPGYRVVQRAAPRRDGLGEPVETWIREKLEASPRARVSEVAGFLKLRAGAEDAEARLPAPSALYRRIGELRSSGRLKRSAPYGESLLIDRVPLASTIDVDGVGRHPVLTMVVDVGTGVALGSSLRHAGRAGMREAVSRGSSAALHFEYEGLDPVPLVKDVEITPPADDPLFGEVLASMNMFSSLQARFRQVSEGNRGRGVGLAKIFGSRLGPIEFRPNATDLLTTEEPLDPSVAAELGILSRAVSAAVGEWNAKRLPRVKGDGSKIFNRERGFRELPEFLSVLAAQLMH